MYRRLAGVFLSLKNSLLEGSNNRGEFREGILIKVRNYDLLESPTIDSHLLAEVKSLLKYLEES